MEDLANPTYAPEFRELSLSEIDLISGGQNPSGNWGGMAHSAAQAGIQGGIWGVAGYGAAKAAGATTGQALKAGAWGFAAGASSSAAGGK